jgi:hypothetical protein
VSAERIIFSAAYAAANTVQAAAYKLVLFSAAYAAAN